MIKFNVYLQQMKKHILQGVIVLALVSACSCVGRQPAQDAAPPADGAAPSTPAASRPNTARMTLAQFNELREGMSYKEAVEIIGGEGRKYENSDESGKTEYRWEGVGRPGAYAELTFQNDKLTDKNHFGLM